MFTKVLMFLFINQSSQETDLTLADIAGLTRPDLAAEKTSVQSNNLTPAAHHCIDVFGGQA